MTGSDPGRTEPEGDDRDDRRGTRYALISLVVLLVGSYAATVALAGDDMPTGTRVAGVALGGLSTEQAEERLRTELLPRSRQPVELRVDGRAFRLDPADAGLSIDVEATVSRAHGGSRVDPRRLWRDLTGTVGPVEPVVQVDQDALIAAVRGVAARADRSPREPSIDFVDQRPVTHPPARGLTVDTAGAIVALLDGWLVDDWPVELPVEIVRPTVGRLDLHRAVSRLARPAMDGPVRLRTGGRTVAVRPRAYAPALTFEVADGELGPVVDTGVLARRVPRLVTAGDRPPTNATVVLRHGRPAVVPARPGVRTGPVRVAAALGAALARRNRTARIGGSPVAARVSTREARGWRIRQRAGSASAAYRGSSLTAAAARVDGTVLRPGDTFSLGDRLGDRLASGATGADVAQLATAIYRAALEAGMTIVERHPRRFYDPGFPRGYDATVDLPSADLRLAGSTPYGVLVQVSTSARADNGGDGGGRLDVRLWSTRFWSVTTQTSAPYDRTRPGRRLGVRPGCEPRPGRAGFTVDVVRDLHHGARDRSDTVTTTYAPLPAVLCPRR